MGSLYDLHEDEVQAHAPCQYSYAAYSLCLVELRGPS